MRNRTARRVMSLRIALTQLRVICHHGSAFRKNACHYGSETRIACLTVDERSADERIYAGLIFSFWSLNPCSRDEIFWRRRLSEPQ
ncbi:hypothetical protein OZ411_11540 [Bradyrhizobium sp. Arg237L]|uniref:hypothetical protein n=1 Tax=Bradyrhizobium sp. Arg237L TaxID=3003352 RepID=UPI00249ED757|nr:hypothetical protein [Bradyrhizobium sp. Arg237L]MDI4233447.1 hypothetical protein [Bradyrhizobium sp. Arg237L]